MIFWNKGYLLLDKYLENAKKLYDLNEYELSMAPGHDGGRNQILICKRNGNPECVLRFSMLGDRTKEEYLAEAEFVHYLAEKRCSRSRCDSFIERKSYGSVFIGWSSRFKVSVIHRPAVNRH